MTTRDLGETGITLIGVYFGVAGVIGVINVVGSYAIPPIEGTPANAIAIANTVSVVGTLAVAGLCIHFAGELAQRFFSERHVGTPSFSRRDLLRVGLILMGVSTVAGALPGLLQFAGRAVLYAEASRQEQFLPYLERSWEQLANRALECVLGVVLVVNAQRLASTLDSGRRRNAGVAAE